MPSLVTKSVVAWLWALSVMLVPGVLILLMWRSLSHRGDFTLSGSEKLLRLVIFVGNTVLPGAFIGYFVTEVGPRGLMEYNEITF